VAGLDLAEEHEADGAVDGGSGAGVVPRLSVGAGGQGVADDPVVAGVEPDVIDPVAPAVVTGVARGLVVDDRRVLLEGCTAHQRADAGELRGVRVRGEGGDGLDEGGVERVFVDVDAGSGLVKHGVGLGGHLGGAFRGGRAAGDWDGSALSRTRVHRVR
jgi:hypothetical protein